MLLPVGGEAFSDSLAVLVLRVFLQTTAVGPGQDPSNERKRLVDLRRSTGGQQLRKGGQGADVMAW